VYGIQPGSAMTLTARGKGSIEVLCDGESLGTVTVDATDFTAHRLNAALPEGEHDFTLRLTGCITLDWFSITAE